jgi:hypothetical protein
MKKKIIKFFGDSMKKLMFFIIFIFLLISCDNKNEIEVEVVDGNNYVYAIDYNDKKIKKVSIDYEINDYNDIFNLYTIYQNRLPLGYYINANSNVSLIKSYVNENNVYYVVDKYISLTKDINLFLEVLSLSNNLLGYNKTFIVYNNKTFGI